MASSISAVTAVAAAIASTKIAGPRGREAILITNDAVTNLYLRLGTDPASATDYSVKLLPGDYYELIADYEGEIQGIWSGADATGKARVTELI
jgi:hypothetical protein